MNYTKGEWKVVTLQGKYEGDYEIECKVENETIPDTIATVYFDEANAHLIAASPRLLQFVEHLADEGNIEAKKFLETLDLKGGRKMTLQINGMPEAKKDELLSDMYEALIGLIERTDLLDTEECDHDVGICWCSYKNARFAANQARLKAEGKEANQ